MVNTFVHPREAERLHALQNFGVLDTPKDEAFDGLARLAARLCRTPVALISFVDAGRLWFKSHVGFSEREVPREQGFCAAALLEEEMFIVPDAALDARFSGVSLSIGEQQVRFYAGVPLRTPQGLPLGTLCVMDADPRPRGLTSDERQHLELLADQVGSLLVRCRDAQRQEFLLKESVHRTKNIVSVAAAIAARTLSESDNMADAKKGLASRLQALSNIQGSLLTDWEDGASIRRVIEQQIAAFGHDDARFLLEGADVRVCSDAAEGIGLAVHELATNAVKYGALSVSEGQIGVRWTKRGDGGVLVEWQERGGPPPQPDDQPKGFGSVVVGAMASQKIGGEAKLSLPPEGARWTADVAASQVMPNA